MDNTDICLDARELATTVSDRLAFAFRAQCPWVVSAAEVNIIDDGETVVSASTTSGGVSITNSDGYVAGTCYLTSQRMSALARGYYQYALYLTVEVDGTNRRVLAAGGRLRVEDDHLPRAFLGIRSDLFSLNRRDLEVRQGTMLRLRIQAVSDASRIVGVLHVRTPAGTWSSHASTDLGDGMYALTLTPEETAAMAAGRYSYAVTVHDYGRTEYATVAKGLLWVRPGEGIG